MAEPTVDQQGLRNDKQLDNAIRALHQKKPVPEIDFTLHSMEDGTEVSTLDRVCKGEKHSPLWSAQAYIASYRVFLDMDTQRLSYSLYHFILMVLLQTYKLQPSSHRRKNNFAPLRTRRSQTCSFSSSTYIERVV